MSQELYILGQNNISNYVHVHGTLTHRAEVMSMIKAMMMMQSGGLVGNQARGNHDRSAWAISRVHKQ